MPTLILYKSKHGAAKQYAQWIHEEIADSKLFSVDIYDFNDIEQYENLIVTSGTYLGDIAVRSYLSDNWAKFQNKKVYLLAVGIVFGNDGEIGFNLLPDKIKKHIGYSKVTGKIEVDNLNFWEKFIVKITRAKDSNQVLKENIKPVLDYFRS